MAVCLFPNLSETRKRERYTTLRGVKTKKEMKTKKKQKNKKKRYKRLDGAREHEVVRV